jgi:hypothetical protein
VYATLSRNTLQSCGKRAKPRIIIQNPFICRIWSCAIVHNAGSAYKLL